MLDFIMWIGGFVITGIFSLIGWVITMLFSRLKDHQEAHEALEKDFNNHRLYSAQTFVTKSDISEMKTELVGHLLRIETKLDGKADK